MDREHLHGTDLASLRQPTLCHLSIVQRNRIAASGNLRSHPADDEILAVDDEHEGGAALDGGKVGERERDRDQRARAESKPNLASHAVHTSSSGFSHNSLKASSVARSSGANSSFRIPSTSAFLRSTRASPDSRSTRSVSRLSLCLVRTSFGITIWPLLDTFTMCTGL